MDQKVQKTFDQLADRYDSWFDRHNTVFQSELEALKKVTPQSGEGLEVGVGSGRFAAALGIKTGVDPSEKLRTLAKSRGINVFDGIAESLPFPSDQFDFVLFGTVLCYLDSPLQGLSEAKRVLKPGGSLIIGMIDRNSALGKSYEARKKDNLFYRDAHFYSVDEVISLMNQVGFDKKETYQTIFSPISEIHSLEPVKPGYGEGGFVVIRAIDRLRGFDAEVGAKQRDNF
ncbi:MAG: class I SAM-dependent methyltransferase [Gammaproteobacteria bacterium]